MPYLGNAPSATFQSVAYQDLTGGTGTSFTLSHAVASAMEIEVFVNNVRQEPTVAYTVAGTALTMTGTIAATDDFYVVFQGKAVGSVSHPTTSPLVATTGAFTGNVTSSGSVTATSFSGDGSALTGIVAGSEYFLVRLDADSAVIASGTDTVVDFGGNGTVIHDTASNVDTTNDAYEFDSSNGVYLINYAVGIRSALLTTEQVIDGYAFLEFSSDTFSTIDRPFAHVINARDGTGDELGGFVLTKTQLYKVTASGTKVRLVAGCAINSAGWQIEASLQGMTQGTVPNDSFVTSMSIIRIA